MGYKSLEKNRTELLVSGSEYTQMNNYEHGKYIVIQYTKVKIA